MFISVKIVNNNTKNISPARYKIAQKIRSWRLKQKYTLKDLVDKTGIKYHTLLRYEQGTCGIPTKKLKVIAEALSVHVGSLFPRQKVLRENCSFNSAIEGIKRTGKKNQQPIFVDETDPKIFDDKSRFEKPEGVPSPSDVSEKSINLGEGREVYNKKSSNRQNPFIPALSKIEPSASENAELRWFKSRAVKAKSVDELNKIVDQALSTGIRINAYSEGQKSFADTVISKMPSIKCKENEKEDIICELMLNGAIFSYDLLQDKGISEMHNKLYQEIRPQIDEWLKELREIGESAIENEGIIEDVEIDNQTFFMKFSDNSKVNIARVLEGTKNLGLTTGEVKLGGDIIEIGNSKVEVRSEKEGERNYVDVSDNSAFEITFPTSIGSLKIIIYHDPENDHKVEIRVADKEMWSELQKRGEVIGKGCFFGGILLCLLKNSFKFLVQSGVLNKLCQTAFLAQLNFQSTRKENVKLGHS